MSCRKVFGVFACLLFLSFSLIAQRDKGYIIAEHNDGSIYIGEKLGEEDDIIQIRIITRDTIHVDRKVAKRIFDHKNANVFKDGSYYETKGMCTNFSLGFGPAIGGDELLMSTHLQAKVGYRMDHRWTLYAGGGFEFNQIHIAGFTFDTQFQSLFFAAKYYLYGHKNRLYGIGRFGQGFAANNNDEFGAEHSGGFNVLIGLGLSFPNRAGNSYYFQLGQYFQQAEGSEFFLDPAGNEIQADFDVLFRQLMFKFGWEFG